MTVPEWPDKKVPPINYAMLDLLECVCDAIAVLGQGPVCHCMIHAGERVSWDYCGECDSGFCGMSYIRPGNAFVASTFPTPDGSSRLGCAGPLAYELEVGILRCFPAFDAEDGEPNSPELVAEASLLLMEDHLAIRTAIECCESPHLKTKTLLEWQPVGPSGNCVGGYWNMLVDPAPWGA